MSVDHLEPLVAAHLAADVYIIAKDEFSRELFVDKYKERIHVNKSFMSEGKTGACLVVKKKHVMVFLGMGKGKYEGQAFVAIKGTASLYDALTDLNTGVHSSHTGFGIHQGFYYAFDSILNDLRKFLIGLKGVRVIHCVGHSLGGAIATLAADWIKTANIAPTVGLYTFGSPRVGLKPFANRCTSTLRPENIFRVSHQTDPVPMVPTWPFFHVPDSGQDYLLYSPSASAPWEYHFMKHYIDSAKKSVSWPAMRRVRPQSHMDATVERWLKSDGVLSVSANTLDLLNASLLYVLKKVAHVAGILVVGGFATTFTLLDRLAFFIAKAAKLQVEVSVWVFHLVRKMAALIGIKVKEGVSLTVEFVRTVFMRLHQKISEMISYIGRAIG